ncbi:hypothetical protein [Rhodophyticola porphyridii]|uniref:hypothetical protein n=1 Tax=Rhodophyticola porphyridii TaxID=1852017 RepID=UPI0011C3B0DB|nr:hypothetical protein [Rhodophyticola porphyridii]
MVSAATAPIFADQPPVSATLRCDVAVPDMDGQVPGLCGAVQMALSQAHGLSFGDDPADLAFVMTIHDLRPDLIVAHLEWRSAAAKGRGPRIRFGLLDTTLSPALHQRFADGLVRSAPLPFSPAPSE